MKTRKLSWGRYETIDGKYVIERSSGSTDEWDTESDPEWFLYDKRTVDRGNYGPPEAIAEFRTKRAALEYLQHESLAGKC